MSTPDTDFVGTPEKRPGFLSSLLTAVTFAILLLLGAAVGLVSTTSAGWLTRYWDAGGPVPLLSVAGLLVFLALLYAACRLCGWGSRRWSGAIAFAVGFLIMLVGTIGYMPGGDIVLTNHIMHNVYLFGAMLALTIAVVHSRPLPPPGVSGTGVSLAR